MIHRSHRSHGPSLPGQIGAFVIALLLVLIVWGWLWLFWWLAS